MYRKPSLFKYLTEAEAEIVVERFRNIKMARVPMDTSTSANPENVTEPPAQTVEGGTRGGEEPSQAADENVKSGRQMVIDAVGRLYSTAEDANCVCTAGQLNMSISHARTLAKMRSRTRSM